MSDRVSASGSLIAPICTIPTPGACRLVWIAVADSRGLVSWVVRTPVNRPSGTRTVPPVEATFAQSRKPILGARPCRYVWFRCCPGCASMCRPPWAFCCYSGAFPVGSVAKADQEVQTLERFHGKGRAVLTASDATQYSFEGDDLRGSGKSSIFTRYLVEAMRSGE